MTAVREIDVSLIGLGHVGRNFLRILETKETRLRDQYGLRFRVVCIADSSGVAVDPTGFDPAAVRMHKETGGKVAELAGFQPGLTPAAAERAMKRCYDEPFILVKGDPGRLRAAIERRGCTMTRGGRFFHILQGCDKGHAVQILTDIYRKQRDRVLTIGLGDAPNDEPLFQAVDRAFLVQKTPGHWVDLPSLPHLEKIEGVGPEGWVHAVSRLLASVFPAS